MLAHVAEAPFADPDWRFEVKWDGYRAIAATGRTKVKLHSRNGLAFEDRYPPVVEALRGVDRHAVLDGEIVAFDRRGKPSFQHLQHYGESPDAATLVYVVFDLLELDGEKLYPLALADRQRLLAQLITPTDGLRLTEFVDGDGVRFFQQIKERGLEGLMAKRLASPYTPGRRSRDWLKVRNHRIEDAIVCGFTAPGAGRTHFGSLVLGMHAGKRLVPVGHVGTGFNDRTLAALAAAMAPLVRTSSPFDVTPRVNRSVSWLRPNLVCSVKYTEWTRDGHLRHPVFQGLRPDKEAQDVTKSDSEKNHALKQARGTERPATARKKTAKKRSGGRAKAASSKAAAQRILRPNGKDRMTVDVEGTAVAITHPSKLYFPGDGITKGDVIVYYQAVYPLLGRYLTDRPQSLKRTPNGLGGEGFYQKNAGPAAPDWVPSVTLYSESAERDIEYILCNDRATLMYLNNLGCIELNPWSSRTVKLDHPDYLVMDLDPSDGNAFEDVVEAAQVVRDVLKRAGATCFVKTSGATGIHVYVPTGARYTYEDVRACAHALARRVAEQLPETTTLERSLRKRPKGRIYLDYLQNKRGQTLASVYSLRPRPGAPASTPLDWKEVKRGLDPLDFNIRSMPKRIARRDDLFAGVLGKAVGLKTVLKKLER